MELITYRQKIKFISYKVYQKNYIIFIPYLIILFNMIRIFNKIINFFLNPFQIAQIIFQKIENIISWEY